MKSKKMHRMNERQLHNIITESVNRVLNEMTQEEYAEMQDSYDNSELSDPVFNFRLGLRGMIGKFKNSTDLAIKIMEILSRNVDEKTLSLIGRTLSRRYPYN